MQIYMYTNPKVGVTVWDKSKNIRHLSRKYAKSVKTQIFAEINVVNLQNKMYNKIYLLYNPSGQIWIEDFSRILRPCGHSDKPFKRRPDGGAREDQ